jgi:hypothetical protein
VMRGTCCQAASSSHPAHYTPERHRLFLPNSVALTCPGLLQRCHACGRLPCLQTHARSVPGGRRFSDAALDGRPALSALDRLTQPTGPPVALLLWTCATAADTPGPSSCGTGLFSLQGRARSGKLSTPQRVSSMPPPLADSAGLSLLLTCSE